jgi:hypothetical protein
MSGNGANSEVDAPMYATLAKGEKHMPYRESVGTTEYIIL